MTDAPRVRLRQATLDDAELLDAWADSVEAHGEFNDFGVPRTRSHRETLAKGPMLDADHGELIVELIKEQRPIGTVGWHAVFFGPNTESRAWNIGIALIPGARGRGFGTEAQRLIAEHLFATTDVNRVEASTDLENLAEQRSLEKAGYIREGIQRGSQFRAGTFHDLVTYSRMRSDPG